LPHIAGVVWHCVRRRISLGIVSRYVLTAAAWRRRGGLALPMDAFIMLFRCMLAACRLSTAVRTVF
jgi:hypothetical protein